MDKNAFMRMKAGDFVRNNGIVIRRINLLRTSFIKLQNVWDVVRGDGMESREFLDSVNYLQQEGYIKLRTIKGKIETMLADAKEYTDLEALVSARGIRLLSGHLQDELVDV